MNIQLTREQLLQIAPKTPQIYIDTYLPALNDAMAEGQINTINRIACFLGQILHESYQLKYMREEWGPTTQQLRYERDFAHPWPPTTQDHTNRLAFNLGNFEAGDGKTMRGAGPIQITGRNNILKASIALYGDDRLIKTPALLDDALVGFKMAVWFWTVHNLNTLADKQDIVEITHIINGGENGLDARKMFTHQALKVLTPTASFTPMTPTNTPMSSPAP